MKKTALFLFVAFALTSCIQVRHNMSDESILKERRQVASFERITLMGSPTVIYSQSDSTSVYVDAPADILSCLETTVEDNCLTIRFRDELKNIVNFSMIDADDVKVYVTSPDLTDVLLTGSGDFVCRSHFDTDNLRLELKGAGDMEFADVICDNLDITLVGSGDLEVRHAVVQVSSSVELVGSGDVKVGYERTPSTNLRLKGSGDIKASFIDAGAVVSDLRGSGDISLSGHVRSSQQSLVGTGDYHTNQLNIIDRP